METLWKDVRFALRMLRRTPGVAAAAVVALALGIGANTAIFSVVDGVLLRPLPYRDSQALVTLSGLVPALEQRSALSYPEFKDILAQSRTLANAGVYESVDANLTGGGGAPMRISAGLASATLLPTLGVEPLLGRNFTADEERRGGDDAALLDFALWQSRFAGNANVVGQTILVDNQPYRIVGVLPRGFQIGGRCDLWLPLSTSREDVAQRGSHWLKLVARTRPGVTRAALDADLDAIAARTLESYRKDYLGGWKLTQRPLIDQITGDVRLALFVLLGAVAFVLLIACANVANLMLARAAARQREMAIRTALGAGRARLIRQLLTESLLLSLVGGALGVLVALWGVDALVALAPDALPRANEVALDARVLLFSAGLTLATGVGFGLLPALSASRPDLHDGLRDGARGASATRGRLKRALVVGELALSLVLLVGTGLMLRSFLALRAVDPGLEPAHVLTLHAALPAPKGPPGDEDRARWVAWFARATARLRQLPGVRFAAAADYLPFDGNNSRYSLDIEGRTPASPGELRHVETRQVTAGYFEALGVRVVSGRSFSDGDDSATAPGVVVINQAMARRYFADSDPIGRRVRLHAGKRQLSTIVGVVADVRGYGLDQPALPELYVPYAQAAESSSMALVVRTDGDAAALVGAARAALGEVDAGQPIFDVLPLRELVAQSLAQRYFALVLMLVFAGVALLLAAVGIYGVMSYTVAQRTQEIGIRVALGAPSGSVLKMVVADGMRLVALGLVLGVGGALALTRLLSSMLYGVSATDAPTFAAIAALLALVALTATVIPARRATRVDPMLALRAD